MTLKQKCLDVILNSASPQSVEQALQKVGTNGERKNASVSSALYDLFNTGAIDAGKTPANKTVFVAPGADGDFTPMSRNRKRKQDDSAKVVNIFITLPGPDGTGEVKYPLPLAQKIYGELQLVFESGLFKSP